MNPTAVYIAAPFSAHTQELRESNVMAAILLSKLAVRDGLTPVCVHPLILLGVFGDDGTPAERAAGQAHSLRLLNMVRHYGGKLWVLEAEPGKVSDGVQLEINEWRRRHGGMRSNGVARRGHWGVWRELFRVRGMLDEWQDQADAHLAASLRGLAPTR